VSTTNYKNEVHPACGCCVGVVEPLRRFAMLGPGGLGKTMSECKWQSHRYYTMREGHLFKWWDVRANNCFSWWCLSDDSIGLCVRLRGKMHHSNRHRTWNLFLRLQGFLQQRFIRLLFGDDPHRLCDRLPRGNVPLKSCINNQVVPAIRALSTLSL